MLDLNYLIAVAFTPRKYIDEWKGMADGSGGSITLESIRRANFIPEIIKARCSIVGAWGAASKDKLYHLRALDWDVEAPMSKYPAITIYEFEEPGSTTVANVGYAGLQGILTGISKRGVSAGEKVWYD